MFSSIQCAANWTGWQSGLTAWAIVLGDQPHLKFITLEALLTFHREHPHEVCQPEFGGHRRHPVILPLEAFERLAQSGAETLKEFLKSEPRAPIKCPINDPGLGIDLDTPEDYERVRGTQQ
jgi:molybdenum cofactor cytidylyltransferase